jgi:hypothetical protein
MFGTVAESQASESGTRKCCDCVVPSDGAVAQYKVPNVLSGVGYCSM